MFLAKKYFTWWMGLMLTAVGYGQSASVAGKVTDGEMGIGYAVVHQEGSTRAVVCDSLGAFVLHGLMEGVVVLEIQAIGYEKQRRAIDLTKDRSGHVIVVLMPTDHSLREVVVSGTMKTASRSDSPVPVELYSSAFLRKNPGPSLMESLGNIGGIRTQNNCNICSTGDIHINGMEGAYTMVMMDGMPIVSSLGSVYGLFGIPRSLIERVEIVRGPASALYGSESMGGLIDVITKQPDASPRLSLEWSGNSWLENQLDLGGVWKINKRWTVLTGGHYYTLQNPADHNDDGFTDVTQQARVSVFQKWQMNRKSNRVFTLSARYLYEDRWGGDTRWTQEDRGKDRFYGESIYTNRAELFGVYQLPVQENVRLQWSFVEHRQNSYYGLTSFIGLQRVAFVQMTWDKKVKHWDGLLGLANRYTYYDDNTIVTAQAENLFINAPDRVHLPGLFVQTEWVKYKMLRLLAGMRLDYHAVHGPIATPRFALKWNISDEHVVRVNAGSGFRVLNVFSEDHSALTGARDVIVANRLMPERSVNGSLDYQWAHQWQGDKRIVLNANLFYTHFFNRIVPDYTTDVNAIYYDNLDGYATNRGLFVSLDAMLTCRWKINGSMTYSDQTLHEQHDGMRSTTRPLLAERFSAAWTITHNFERLPLSIDYTGNLTGPMLLPTLGSLDPRPGESPWWSIQNVQLTYRSSKAWEFFGGVKNLLNWTPGKNLPFLIARAHDPFDRGVQFDEQGGVVANANNPYALTFDPTYAYAPNQGIRFYLGLRYQW